MTIREIEALSGMTRANIRYYEHEKLLFPERTDNNYRNYSEEDLSTLLKIKLLRQLQVPLDVIKQLQTGQTTLIDALSDKLQQLEDSMTSLQYSASICRDILASTADYNNLDARDYLLRVQATAQTGTSDFSLGSDVLPRVNHPWRRFFARGLDVAIYATIWSAISYLALRWNTSASSSLRFLEIVIAFIMMLLLEPVLLSTLGTTPGKWLFGLQVRRYTGQKLSYLDALIRTWMVIQYGEGFSIPIYNIYRLYKSYKTCADNEELPWDEDIAYTIKDTKPLRIVAYLGAQLLLLGLSVFIFMQADLPINKGMLTTEEFVQNFNDMLDYKKINYGKHLDTDGSWVEDEADGTTTIHLFLSDIALPDLQITETNGDVTNVFFEVTAYDKTLIYDNFTNLINLALKSYVCAQNDINFINQTLVIKPENTAFNNFSFTIAGITVTNTVTYEGYHATGNYTLFSDMESNQYFHMEFSMERHPEG